jgi:signal transduction histidine kinase
MTSTPAERARLHRLRGLADMAGGMAHDFNQPLTIIRGCAENLLIARQRGWDIPPERINEKLATIVDQCDRISGLIDRVRSFAGGAADLSLAAIDPGLAVDDAIALVKVQLGSRGIRIEKRGGSEGRLVRANRHALAEVLLELLRNARDAIGRTGQSGGLVAVTIASDPDCCVISVDDSGCGISPAILERIFDPFNPERPAGAGPGLGLPSARLAIEAMGGRLEISSSTGSGTIVAVHLSEAVGG